MPLAQQAAELTNQEAALMLDTLAPTYAEAGKFAQAIATGRRALELAEAARLEPLVEVIRGWLQLYQSERPYRE